MSILEAKMMVYCECGKTLPFRTCPDRCGMYPVTVEPCSACLKRKRDEGYEAGVKKREGEANVSKN